MAFDGRSVAAIVKKLNDKLLPCSISKVAQPMRDGLLLTIRKERERHFLFLSANSSSPALCLREEALPSPDSAPAFCMALRKHIGGGRIVQILQPTSDVKDMKRGLERIVIFKIEHKNELGDIEIKYLIQELMGRHSNIILTAEDLRIIDSIRHVSPLTSSLREVGPGKQYFFPDELKKADPLSTADIDSFFSLLGGDNKGESVFKRLYQTFSGISPALSSEILSDAFLDGFKTIADLSESERESLFRAFRACMDKISMGIFSDGIIEDAMRHDTEKEKRERLIRESAGIREILKHHTERAVKKQAVLEKEIEESENREIYRRFGELINAYGYSLKGGETYLDCEDYLSDYAPVRVPLDPALSASKNAARYFEKYEKLKRKEFNAKEQLKECENNLYRLRSLWLSLDLSESAADIDEIRSEMREEGYLKKEEKGRAKKKKDKKSPPLHFVSSDGLDIFVGRNSLQNEELSFKQADPDDWWFHAKGIPGSHVIVKTGRRNLPDSTCLEAAALAAYYSSAPKNEKTEVDYVKKKELRKVRGAPRGYLIYHSNYSIMIEPRKSV